MRLQRCRFDQIEEVAIVPSRKKEVWVGLGTFTKAALPGAWVQRRVSFDEMLEKGTDKTDRRPEGILVARLDPDINCDLPTSDLVDPLLVLWFR